MYGGLGGAMRTPSQARSGCVSFRLVWAILAVSTGANVPVTANDHPAEENSTLTKAFGIGRLKGVLPSWKVNPESDNWSWPTAHSYCLPCQEKVVGTCFLSHCYAWRGPTECTMTRCACAKFFCASQDTSPGMQRCEPQVCVNGPRPLPFIPNFAVKLFYRLLGRKAFPPEFDYKSPETWDLLLSAFFRCSWLLVVAAIIIFLTLAGFFYYKAPKISKLNQEHLKLDPEGESLRIAPEWHDEDHGENSVREMCSHRPSISSAFGGGDLNRHKVKIHKRPSMKPLIVTSAVILILCTVGVFGRDSNWAATRRKVTDTLNRFHQNALVLQEQGDLVQQTCVKLNVTLQDMHQNCSHDPVLLKLASVATDAFSHYVKLVFSLNEVLNQLPGISVEIMQAFKKREVLGFWVPLMPVLAIAIVSTFIVSTALVISHLGGLRWAVRLTHTFKVGSILFILLILVVALFGTVGFMVSMVLGSFCYDVDTNVLNVVKSRVEGTNMTDIYGFAGFYITGRGVMNPAMGYSRRALWYINEINEVYSQFEGVIKAYYPTCHPLEEIRMEKIHKEAKSVLKHCATLLEPANIYPYYDNVVREGVCTEVIRSLATFPVFSLIMGLICFPYLAVVTHRYLVHWSYWKHSQHGIHASHEEEASDKDTEDEFDDDMSEWSEDASESSPGSKRIPP